MIAQNKAGDVQEYLNNVLVRNLILKEEKEYIRELL